MGRNTDLGYFFEFRGPGLAKKYYFLMLVINKISGFKTVLEKKFANTGFSIGAELTDPLISVRQAVFAKSQGGVSYGIPLI